MADSLDVVLQRVIELGKKEIGKPYSGPIVGQPDSYRYGDPGWDCSSFVKTMWERASGMKLFSWAYTDTIAKESTWMKDPKPGCIVVYHYPDSSQNTTFWPHTGIWLSTTDVLDARYPQGVGIHKHVTPVQQGDRFRRTYLPAKFVGGGEPDPKDPPGDKGFEIIARYLTDPKAPVLSALEGQIVASKEHTAQLENIYHEILRNQPPPA